MALAYGTIHQDTRNGGTDAARMEAGEWLEALTGHLETVLSTTRFPEAVRPNELYQLPNCDFSKLFAELCAT
jgi:hypothetical protein